jgi:lipopolysaccharide heptosyltransferase II
VHALRRRFPDCRLDYVVETGAAPIVRHSPDLDQVIEIARPRGVRRLRYDFALARRLRRARYDVAIDFHGGPRSAWLTWATGAPRRIGYDIPGRRFCYTTRVPWHPELVPPRHSVLNQWALLTPLGFDPPTPGTDPVRMTPGPEAARSATERLRQAGVPDDAPLVVIHVSAGNPFRRWPRSSFAQVAAALARDDPRRRIMITAGPSEAGAAAAVADDAAAAAGDLAPAIVRGGEPSLEELHVIMSRAQLFIGGDSGPLHVAATTGVRVVALFGPTLPARSLPWREGIAEAVEPEPLPCRPCHQRHCVPGDFRCLTGITPERVLAAARRALQGRA